VSTRGWLLFGLMCVIWGIPYLLIRVAVRDLSPAVLVFARTGGAALLLLPIAAARRELAPVLRARVPVLAFALVEIAIPWVLLSSAERRISSSLSGLLIAAVPLVGALIARTTGARDRLGLTNTAGLLLGLGGVAALVGLDLGTLNAFALVEVAFVVAGYAIGPAILAKHLGGVPALGVIAVSLTLTAIVYAPIAAFSLPRRSPTAGELASVGVLIVVCTALAFLLFFALISEIGPVRATVITYVNPAVAVALGVGLLGEHFTAGMGVGFVLILAGSLLATRRERHGESGLRLARGETQPSTPA
jgi:drug/metabolite transporter (DMT)-like permease